MRPIRTVPPKDEREYPSAVITKEIGRAHV